MLGGSYHLITNLGVFIVLIHKGALCFSLAYLHQLRSNSREQSQKKNTYEAAEQHRGHKPFLANIES